MAGTTKKEAKELRDIYYFRKRLKNRIFSRLSAFFAEEAERTGITKRDLAARLNRNPSQITRWLSGPSNLTLDTLSDLLLAMDAEAEPPKFVRFADRVPANYGVGSNQAHPLVSTIISGGATSASGTSTKAKGLTDVESLEPGQPMTSIYSNAA